MLRPVTAVLTALACAVALSAIPASAADVAGAPPLTWGFKASWRTYVAEVPQVSGGATVVPTAGLPSYQLTWAFEAGEYNPATGTTTMRYQGTAHWRKYPASSGVLPPPPGYTGPMDIDILDVMLSDPVVTIGPDGASVSVVARSRQLDDWLIQDLGRVEVVTLDVSETTPTVAGGTTNWTGIPAATAGSSFEVFANNYPVGREVDAVSFSYTGPGGAPDLSDNFEEQDSVRLALDENRIITTNGNDEQYKPWWIDRERRIVHYRSLNGTGDWVYRAFSLDTLTEIGDPLVLPPAEAVVQDVLLDTTNGRVLYRRLGETQTQRSIRFDVAQGKYVLEMLATPIPIEGNQNTLNWDPVTERAFNLERDGGQWQLHYYAEQGNGSWAVETWDLPDLPYQTGGSINAPSAMAAPDGSLVVLGDTQAGGPATVPGAILIVVYPDFGLITADPIPGTQVQNTFARIYETLQPGPGAQAVLMKPSVASGPVVQTVRADAMSSTPAVQLPGLDTLFPTDFAVDREDGTIWVGGWQSKRLAAVRGGNIVTNRVVPERHPRGGPVLTGPGHVVYSQTNDGSPAGFGGSPIYGFGRWTRVGRTATVTTQPQSQTVALGVGEQSETVTFTSDANPDPAATRQWQAKLPGASRFKAIDGETGATLTVEAVRGLGGAQYRAVYENAAGRVSSDAATLTVSYAPRVAVDVVNASVVEGADASFQVMPESDPEPTITWQRRVDGFWQDIAPSDDNFAVAGGTLTVRDTNRDQDGARFRARVANPVATVYSRAATLTVAPSSEIPPEGLELTNVALDWSGSQELQKAPPFGGSSYFSAGVSDGAQPTYAATSPGVRVLQVAADGTESTAAWFTRAAHLGSGGRQVVRLTGGHADVEGDGSARIEWTGSFSVNFYGGLVPFTVTDPTLVVDEDGTGTLTGDLSGYASSQANPNERTPLAPVPDVTIATFSDMAVDPAGQVEVLPDYADVEVSVPAGTTPQNRSVQGWGAWPQPFVDFHVATGLSSYWYSSGGSADNDKGPLSFVVDFSGSKPGGEEPPPPPGDGRVPDPPRADAGSATALSLSRSRVAYGVRPTATVRVGTATGPAAGSVRVRVAGRSIERPLLDGAATVSLPGTPRPGTHRVVATYAGAPGVGASTAEASLTVTKARPRLAVTVTDPTIVTTRRGKLRVVATLAGGSGAAAAGQLVVRDGRRIVAVRALRRGRATVVLPPLARGLHYLRASLAASGLQHAGTAPLRTLRVE